MHKANQDGLPFTCIIGGKKEEENGNKKKKKERDTIGIE